jgi:8-oxo-dGTP pyrophosphatase MutT (NUDIX family)
MVSDYVGASVLCFSVHPETAGVYFLLGKERFNPLWPVSSCKWSDFGGRVGLEDTCIEDTATREFEEETMGVVDVYLGLQERQYVCRLDLGVAPKKFVVFVKQIEWDPTISTRFTSLRRNAVVQGNSATLEKCRLWYWSLPHIRHAVACNGVLLRSDGKPEFCRKPFMVSLGVLLPHLSFTHPSVF